MKKNLLNKSMFSIHLNRDDDQYGGELLLGGIDNSLYKGPIDWIPVTKKGYWQIRLANIKVHGKVQFCSNGCEAIVDSGTSLITGPSVDIKTLQKLIGGTPLSFGEYAVGCKNVSSLPSVTFTIGLRDYTITPEQYELSGKTEMCLAGFQPMDFSTTTGSLWILGDIFMSKFYSVFDRENDRVGLAKSRKKRHTHLDTQKSVSSIF
ncbi:unnamed protein product [Staurois parvus]|uniref:Peptidase A1 domain-containing protein n=1 Tax=Staurois parvus TaxID=386267 RepID=A0ABN9DI62_9NEOB|nr:unnamed protein product [Staurois parvus]